MALVKIRIIIAEMQKGKIADNLIKNEFLIGDGEWWRYICTYVKIKYMN